MFSTTQIIMEVSILIAAIFFAALIICLTLSIKNNIRLKRIMTNCESGKLDESITLYYNKISELAKEIEKKEERIETLEKMTAAGIQKYAVVHYDAFDDITNNLSFSIAMLDESNTGFIITSIYGRNNSNLYIKSVLKGKTNATMSDEEVEAFERALKAYDNKLK